MKDEKPKKWASMTVAERDAAEAALEVLSGPSWRQTEREEIAEAIARAIAAYSREAGFVGRG